MFYSGTSNFKQYKAKLHHKDKHDNNEAPNSVNQSLELGCFDVNLWTDGS